MPELLLEDKLEASSKAHDKLEYLLEDMLGHEIPEELIPLIDRLTHEAYVAGMTQECGGIYRTQIASDSTVGNAYTLANKWCKHKGTRI